jgi:Predicted integral membrane protein (DUF2269)
MEYSLLKFFHLIGAVLMGGGLIGVWMADLRSRQLHELKPFSEAVRNIAPLLFGPADASHSALLPRLSRTRVGPDRFPWVPAPWVETQTET